MKLGMLSWSGINMPWYKFCPIWGRFGHHASHKPELLTTSMMVFGRECPTFVDETISIASYCFQKTSRVNIEQQGCCVIFLYFYALTEFSMHLCASFKCELHAHAPVHINWLKNQICVLGCMLMSHARNGNEFQTPGHR